MTSEIIDHNANKTNNDSDVAAADGQRRHQNTTLCLPIIYGSIAFYLGKKADEYATHRWTLYVRGVTGDEDLSPAISKVIFQLHPSFSQPTREISEPPYEITEKGWGEFEASIRILWQDPELRPTVVTHGIKLYPPGLPEQITAQSAAVQLQSEEPVISEQYDEVTFTDPTFKFYNSLKQLRQIPLLSSTDRSYNADCVPHFANSNFSDEALVQRLLSVQKFLEEEILTAKERILKAQEEGDMLDKKIVTVTGEAKSAQASLKPSSSSHPSGSSSGKGSSSKGGGGSSKSQGGSATGSKKKKGSSGGHKKSKAAKLSASSTASSSQVPSVQPLQATTSKGKQN